MASSSSSISSFLGAVVVALVIFFLASSVASGHLTSYDHHHHPWKTFRNFSGCHLGDHRPGLAHLKHYLHRFGYLPAGSRPPANFSDDFDHELQSALVAYQRHFRLHSTGALDASTLSLISKPRCGVPDVVVVNGTASSGARGRNLYTYFPGSPSWPPSKRDLTYAFRSTEGVSAAVRDLFARAFARWSRVTSFTFSEADSGNSDDADISIGFYSGDHGDESAFDGAGGVLAHSFAPTDGRLHVDADEAWVVEGDVTAASSNDDAMDLESVMVHEIGHLLGLGHSPVADAIMYPSIAPRTRKVELTNDDIWGIQNLYGTN